MMQFCSFARKHAQGVVARSIRHHGVAANPLPLSFKPKVLADEHLKDPAKAVAYDFRSDTVTVPTKSMRRLLSQAAVGDDVFNDDPNVQHLENAMANLLGHDGGLFCASGTLTNQLALRVLLNMTNQGIPASVLCDARSHVLCWEAGAIVHQAGAMPISVDTDGDWKDGGRVVRHLLPSDLSKVVPDDGNVHCTPTRVISLENTLNGDIIGIAAFKELVSAARSRNLAVHLDGARLWNACIVEGVSLKEYGSLCDTVSICLSKGLGAPVGSVLVGSDQIIRRARHWRKALGGGMRQAGLMAAAALNAYNDGYPIVFERAHAFARQLSDGLEQIGVRVDNHPVQTNMVFADLASVGLIAEDIEKSAASLNESQLRILGGGSSQVRFVTHYQLANDAVSRLLHVIQVAIDRNQQPINADAVDQY